MPGLPRAHAPRFAATRREGERVTPLELFFDLVFVLALTQCTALIADHPTWEGIAQGMLVLGVLWWAWVGYAWLTSVIDPEEGAVRLVIFVAMAALLIAALSVPEAFDSLGLVFAFAYGVFRVSHIALFMLASPDDDALRHSVIGLAVSTAVGVGLLGTASFFDGWAQGALWALALFLDMSGPYFFGSEGWKLVPGHFAERHGLIVIIALGESIVALGIGAAGELSLGIGTVAVLGVALAAALWWVYFDVVALVSARRLSEAPVGRVQNELARDSYSYIHFALIAGIVLVAFGLKVSIGHDYEHLHAEPAFALYGGTALYLLGLVAFRYRHVRTINRQRLGLAIVLAILIPVATAVPAWLAVAIVVTLLWAMIAYEHRGYGESRDLLRHEAAVGHTAGPLTETPRLLDELLRAGAPSGYEGPAAAVWREAASFAELSSDGIGSSIARVGEASPLLAVVGHIDEIGLVITHIDEKGFLWFAPVGGWDPQILVGQRVEVRGKSGPVLGVVGRKPIHLLEPDQRKKVVELKGLHIDVGAADRDEAAELIRVGDPVVIAAEPQPLIGDRLVSRAMDNRLGAYVALESLRRAHEGGELQGSFAAVAAVQEEIGLFGARTAAFEVRPDIAVAVDVTHATDAPGVDEKELGSSPLGSGPVIGRGSTLSPKVFELLVETAEAEGIEHSVSASGRGTSTDADVLQISRSGIPTGLVSIPLRYMHSPVELVDLRDVEATVELLAAFAARLTADIDFSR